MHRKGRQDAARSKLFSKLAREVTVAAKMGIPDPDKNPRLRAAILAARAENMPKDSIERAIKKSQAGDADTYEEIRYEGYGPGGVAMIVEVLTDNRNRTASGVRAAFTKSGGHLAETGAVAFLFTRVGVIEFDAAVASAEAVLDAAIEAGAEDVVSTKSGHEIYTAQEDLHEVAKALEAKFGEPRKAALVWKPQNTVTLDDEKGEKLVRLLETLEEHDDVQNIYELRGFRCPRGPDEWLAALTRAAAGPLASKGLSKPVCALTQLASSVLTQASDGPGGGSWTSRAIGWGLWPVGRSEPMRTRASPTASSPSTTD